MSTGLHFFLVSRGANSSPCSIQISRDHSHSTPCGILFLSSKLAMLHLPDYSSVVTSPSDFDLLFLPLSLLRTLMITLCPPGWPRIRTLFQGEITGKCNFMKKFNFPFSCILRLSQVLVIKMWASSGGHYSSYHYYLLHVLLNLSPLPWGPWFNSYLCTVTAVLTSPMTFQQTHLKDILSSLYCLMHLQCMKSRAQFF